MDLSGKRVLITAAAQGIGHASVQAYLAAGAEVFAADINAGALEALAGAHKIVLDVTDAAAIERLANELGPLDVLFNCAGVVHSGNILECSEKDWNFALDLNVTAMYRMIRACSFWVEMPTSAPNPNSPPSVKRVEAFAMTTAESTSARKRSAFSSSAVTIDSVWWVE